MTDEQATGDDPELDVDELRTELAQIKDAMGIQERYEAAGEVWLFVAALVVVAAALSQYVHLEQLSQHLHTVIWLGVFGLGFGLWWVGSDQPREMTWTTAGKPNIGLVFAIPYVASIPLQAVVGAYTRDLGYQAESAMVLAIILVMLGVAYGAMGTALKAYYIRRRDRLPFFAGMVLLMGLGVAIPTSPTLERWAYAVFAGVYAVYALVTYVYLVRT